MRANHLLLEKAFVYLPRKDAKDPDDSIYDKMLGMWLRGSKKRALVKLNHDLKYGTKKADIETGEDLKGE
jgi:hypothetical protein